jgi:cation diffusion facilitator CzcD-associated flavoprotein CzcO
LNKSRTSTPAHLPKKRIAIIGTGVTGTSAACQTLSAGLECTLFEASPSSQPAGGIWTRQNSDSGLQIPSDFYKFHPDIEWSCEFPKRDEILRQTQGLWERYGLRERTVFGCCVSGLTEVEEGRWVVDGDGDGGKYGVFDGAVIAVGTCAKMSIPHIQGLEGFGGQTCHSSQLESVDVRGTKVVIVGGGASAVEAMEFAVDHGAASVAVVSRVSRSILRDFFSPFEQELTGVIPQSDKWVIPRWRLLNCLMAAVVFDPLGFCEKVIEWILWFFYYRDLPAGAMPKNLKVFSKTPVCSDRFFDLLVSPDAQKQPGPLKTPRTDRSKSDQAQSDG